LGLNADFSWGTSVSLISTSRANALEWAKEIKTHISSSLGG